MPTSAYVLDNASDQAPPRFAGPEATFDATTQACLAALGPADGWHCWELGAGGGTVAAWLAERVAPRGTVLATDLDPSWMAGLDVANLTVERHDVTADPIPADR
jgi:precorrin-6B methylase 2